MTHLYVIFKWMLIEEGIIINGLLQLCANLEYQQMRHLATTRRRVQLIRPQSIWWFMGTRIYLKCYILLTTVHWWCLLILDTTCPYALSVTVKRAYKNRWKWNVELDGSIKWLWADDSGDKGDKNRREYANCVRQKYGKDQWVCRWRAFDKPIDLLMVMLMTKGSS